MLHLGPEQEIIYTQEVLALREEPNMSTYVNTLESYFTQQGRQLGLQEGELIGLQQGKQIGLQEGERIGLQQGKQIGTHQGAERVLRSLLERRFGSLPSWASAKLEAASAETIEHWSLQLLDAHSLDDVFA
jgi:hypothetical protein